MGDKAWQWPLSSFIQPPPNARGWSTVYQYGACPLAQSVVRWLQAVELNSLEIAPAQS